MKRRNQKLNPKPEGVDRISHLPDDIMVHIISLLDTKDAIRTTALSREWRRRCMWVHVYNLSFDLGSEIVPSQIWSVDRTLELHRALKITGFSLHIQDRKYDDLNLVRWVHFALMHHVEILNFLLPPRMLPVMGSGLLPWMPRCELPEFMFSLDSLREVTTEGCYLSPDGRVGWGSLRVLDVSFAFLLGIEKLSGCPSLEYLRLHNVLVFGGQNIYITQKKLKKLILEQLNSKHYNAPDPEVCIDAPQLEELELSGCWNSITCKLVDAPSLIHVHLDFVFRTGYDVRNDNDERCENAEKELREKVRQIMG